MKATPRHPRLRRNGVTLIECAGASIILGLMLTAGLRAAAGAGASQALSARALTGTLLAEGLLNEVTSLAYADPSGAVAMGLDSGEIASDKSTFDDVDDFDNWTESPPRSPGGVAIGGMTKWTRSVRVFRAQTNSPESNSASESGLKRIEVTVLFSGKVVSQLRALRTTDS